MRPKPRTEAELLLEEIKGCWHLKSHEAELGRWLSGEECLQCKHRDLRLYLSIFVKSWSWLPRIPTLCGVETEESLEAYWPQA